MIREDDRSESWTLIEKGQEELQEGAKQIIQGIETLKIRFKKVSKTLEEKEEVTHTQKSIEEVKVP